MVVETQARGLADNVAPEWFSFRAIFDFFWYCKLSDQSLACIEQRVGLVE